MKPIRQFYNNIESILKSGIQIGDKSETKLKITAKKVNAILNSGHSPYIGYVAEDRKTIQIETTYFDPVLSVEFSKGSIYFIPLVDTDWHGAFFEILKILYWFEQKIIKEEKEKEKEDDSDFDWI
tara:strand:- start:537 stop:911 length:375 start_codon:yes stop_codon:yes gene_type:complete